MINKRKLTSLSTVKKNFTTDNAFNFFNLGYTEEQKTFNISISFPGNSQASFESPTFYRLDTLRLLLKQSKKN